MKFYPQEIDTNSRLEKLVFHEFIWNTGAGQVGQIKNIITDFAVGGVALKIFGLERFWWLVVVLGFAYIIGVYVIGFLVQRKNLVMRRGSVTNKLGNPQLMELLKHNNEDREK